MDGATSNPGFGSVMAGVDGSRSARQTVLSAAAEAARRERPLRIVYGADTDAQGLDFSMESLQCVCQAGRELLDSTAAAVKEQFPGLWVFTKFSCSAPVSSLHRSAGLHGTSVVGSRGADGFGTRMLGPVGLKVVAGVSRQQASSRARVLALAAGGTSASVTGACPAAAVAPAVDRVAGAADVEQRGGLPYPGLFCVDR